MSESASIRRPQQVIFNNNKNLDVVGGIFTDEINLYTDWIINDYASVSAVYGVVFPGKAAKQAFGKDEPFICSRGRPLIVLALGCKWEAEARAQQLAYYDNLTGSIKI